MRRFWIQTALLGAVVAGCAGCATSSGGSGPAGGATSDIDPGFIGASSSGEPEPWSGSTGLAGITTVLPSYVNDSEVASPTPDPLNCPAGGGSEGFSVSLAEGESGYATPQEAIHAFEMSGEQPGYGTSATTWRIVSNGIQMTATAPGVSLDIMSLPNGKWVVDSGERCD